VTSASIFTEMQKPVDTLNSHMTGLTTNGATRQNDTMIDATALPETTTPTQTPTTQHVYNDGTYNALSAFLGAFSGTGFVAKAAAAAAAKTYFAALALLASHSHADGTTGGQLAQVNTHQSADTDVSATSLHHTLGTGAFQAAAGNHTHATLYAPLTGGGTSGTWPISTTGNAATATTAAGVAAGAIVTASIADGAVTGGSGAGAKIAQHTVTLANVADGYVTAQGTPNMTVNVTPITDVNASRVLGTVTGTSPTYPTLPTAGNTRYDLLYYDSTLTLGWKAGVPSAGTPIQPAPDAATKGLAWVLVGSATTAITQGMITDARTSPGTGAGSGGGGGVDLSGKPFVTIGNDGTLTNETDIFGLAGGSYIGVPTTVNGKDLSLFDVHPGLVRRVATDAALGDVLYNLIPGDLLPNLSVSGAVVTLAASVSQPRTIIIQGRQREVTSAITATATGAAGQRFLIADTSTAGTATWAFISPMPTNNSVLPGQEVIATYWYDGTILRLTTVDTSTILSISSDNVKSVWVLAQGTGNSVTTVAGSSSYITNPVVPLTDFWLAKPATIELFNVYEVAFNSSNAGVFVAATIDGVNYANVPVGAATGASNYAGGCNMQPVFNVSAGHHYISQNIIANSGTNVFPLGVGCAVYAKITA
jgi:hypothetical protein